MTFNVDPWYGVSVTHGKKVGPRRWQAEAYIFRRDTQQRVGKSFFGEGGAMTTADDAVLAAAKRELYILGKPADWSGPKDGFSIYSG
jgi:hypothetical protein